MITKRSHPKRRARFHNVRRLPPVTRPPVAATPFPASTMPPTPAENPDELQLPLQPILAAMPMELRAKVMQTPPAGMVISIPLEKILTQLARGAVKITFGELRLAAPGVFVNSGGEHDHKPVMLPLNEILTRLNPALLARRSPKNKSNWPTTLAARLAPADRELKFPLRRSNPAASPPCRHCE
jgi:hypothetical protein